MYVLTDRNRCRHLAECRRIDIAACFKILPASPLLSTLCTSTVLLTSSITSWTRERRNAATRLPLPKPSLRESDQVLSRQYFGLTGDGRLACGCPEDFSRRMLRSRHRCLFLRSIRSSSRSFLCTVQASRLETKPFSGSGVVAALGIEPSSVTTSFRDAQPYCAPLRTLFDMLVPGSSAADPCTSTDPVPSKWSPQCLRYLGRNQCDWMLARKDQNSGVDKLSVFTRTWPICLVEPAILGPATPALKVEPTVAMLVES